MQRVGGQHALVERSSNHGGKHVRLAQGISVLVRIQNLEQRVEVVRGLIVMEHANGAFRTNAFPQIPDGNLHRNHRVLILGRTVIGNNDGLPATIKLDAPNSFLQQHYHQRGTPSAQVLPIYCKRLRPTSRRSPPFLKEYDSTSLMSKSILLPVVGKFKRHLDEKVGLLENFELYAKDSSHRSLALTPVSSTTVRRACAR
jgi:hypothetical protein